MPSGNRLATWDGALRDMRQKRTFSPRVTMNKYTVQATIQ
jgi:hypothetical protein